MSTPKGFKRLTNGSYQFDWETSAGSELEGNLYEAALQNEQNRVFGGNAELDDIALEIKSRLRITANEIFKIGELLYLAKGLCAQSGKKFQGWITETFDFSYESANNFMNVFQYCYGLRHLALEIPVSLLYNVSKPSFPEELREYLFAQGHMEEMTGNRLKSITQKFKEGGFDAIKDDVEEFTSYTIIHRQTRFSLDLCKNAHRTLELLFEKMVTHRRNYRTSVYFSNDEPAAFEINDKLQAVLQTSIMALDTAIRESEEVLTERRERTLKHYDSIAPSHDNVS